MVTKVAYTCSALLGLALAAGGATANDDVIKQSQNARQWAMVSYDKSK